MDWSHRVQQLLRLDRLNKKLEVVRQKKAIRPKKTLEEVVTVRNEAWYCKFRNFRENFCE